MSNSNLLKRDLTDKISVEIVPIDNQYSPDSRVWAINWFNYKTKWLYTLYNRLAAPYVIQVGGQLLFKGHNQRKLFGDEELSRETLLIVTYPKIGNFLDMLTIKAFQLTSLLRVKAVKNFVFGFTKRLDSFNATTTAKIDNSVSYLVYHYQGNEDQRQLYELARTFNFKVFFHGEKIAQLKRLEDGKDDVLAPFFMDGIMVFEMENEEQAINFTNDEAFLQYNMLNKSGFAAIFSRVK